MKTKFELGDAVKVYATLNGVVAETRGVIEGKRIDGMLLVDFGSQYKGLCAAHPKQCRKLVKKPRRRVWIHLNDIGARNRDWPIVVESDLSEGSRIEFIEVKNKHKE